MVILEIDPPYLVSLMPAMVRKGRRAKLSVPFPLTLSYRGDMYVLCKLVCSVGRCEEPCKLVCCLWVD